MRPSSVLVRPIRGGGRNAVRQSVPRRRRGRQTHDSTYSPSLPSTSSAVTILRSSSWGESMRHFHASARTDKPPASYPSKREGVVSYALQTHLQTVDNAAQGYFPDPAHILAEWKLLDREASKIDGGKGKGKAIENRRSHESHGTAVDLAEEEETASMTLPHLDSDFFTSSPFRDAQPQKQEEAFEKDTAAIQPLTESQPYSIHDKVTTRRAHIRDRLEKEEEKLWSTTVPAAMMRETILTVLAEVRVGCRNINSFAAKALEQIEASKGRSFGVQRERRLEEIRMLILSLWTQIVRQSTEKYKDRQKHLVSLINLTEAMYVSTTDALAESKIAENDVPLGILRIRRSTLHRLFAITYDCAHVRQMANRFVREASLRLCARIVRDERLRGSQARYLMRKLISTATCNVECGRSPLFASRVWNEIKISLVRLLDRGVVPFPTLSPPTSTPTYDYVGETMLLLSKCLRGPDRPSAKALVSLATHCVHSGPAKRSEGMEESRTFVCSADQLKIIMSKLVTAKEYRACQALYMLLPSSQKSFKIICFLMKRWSNVRLDFGRKQCEESFVRRETGFSSMILKDALQRMDKNEPSLFQAHLRRLAFSRFAAHADSCNPRALIHDLDQFALLWPDGDRVTRLSTLKRLGGRAQVQVVRTFARSGRLGHAKQWGLHLIRLAMREREPKNDEEKRTLATQLLNVLLHAMFSTQRNKTFVNHFIASRFTARRLSATARRLPRLPSSFVERSAPTLASFRGQLHCGLQLVEDYNRWTGVTMNRESCTMFIRQLARMCQVVLPLGERRALVDRLGWTSFAVQEVCQDVQAMVTLRLFEDKTAKEVDQRCRERINIVKSSLRTFYTKQHWSAKRLRKRNIRRGNSVLSYPNP